MAKTFKIGYLPLSKVNWTNDTLEAARENAIAFLKTLPGVEVMAPDHCSPSRTRRWSCWGSGRRTVPTCSSRTS